MSLQMGQSASVLGALVLGSAAVEARIVSARNNNCCSSGLTGLMT